MSHGGNPLAALAPIITGLLGAVVLAFVLIVGYALLDGVQKQTQNPQANQTLEDTKNALNNISGMPDTFLLDLLIAIVTILGCALGGKYLYENFLSSGRE